MKESTDKTENSIAGLSHLARAWMVMLESWCPAEWQQLLPTLSFEQPDRILPANPLPVLSYLAQMEAQSPPHNRSFIRQLNNLKAELHFNQSYSAADFGAEFLQQYGWLKFLGPDAYWHSDELSSGLVLLGDNITYPEHWHEAEELYFPVSGTGAWYHERHGWQSKSPGDRIVHASNIKHSMRSRGEPLLLLYIWRGGDLVQKSDIDPN